MEKRRVGVVGYGHLGQYLVNAVMNQPEMSNRFEIAFVWNRNPEKMSSLPESVILKDLEQFANIAVGLIIEVCHPDIIDKYGERFLQHADFMAGSPTAFANESIEKKIRAAVQSSGHGCYIPSGALWGAEDIQKMDQVKQLGGLSVTMKKHPSSLKVEPELMGILKEYANDDTRKGECIVYEGPVRKLCPLAPNNVNTMACAALAAESLGFDGVKARLVADKSLTAHVIEIEALGPEVAPPAERFRVSTVRYNPAAVGAVTGNATFTSFLASLMRAAGRYVIVDVISHCHRGKGVHFC